VLPTQRKEGWFRMLRVCAWCGEHLEEGQLDDASKNPVTHGMCTACSERLWRESGGTPILDFLDALDIPTLLLDSDTRVELANPDALELVGKSQAAVAKRLGGEVFDCVNAELPGGCGGTEICSACLVRNTVVACFETGQAFRQVPAALTVRREGSAQEMGFLLTTEKVGQRVLVQIEPVPSGGVDPDEETDSVEA